MSGRCRRGKGWMWTSWNWAIPLASAGWTLLSRFSQSTSSRIRMGTSCAGGGV